MFFNVQIAIICIVLSELQQPLIFGSQRCSSYGQGSSWNSAHHGNSVFTTWKHSEFMSYFSQTSRKLTFVRNNSFKMAMGQKPRTPMKPRKPWKNVIFRRVSTQRVTHSQMCLAQKKGTTACGTDFSLYQQMVFCWSRSQMKAPPQTNFLRQALKKTIQNHPKPIETPGFWPTPGASQQAPSRLPTPIAWLIQLVELSKSPGRSASWGRRKSFGSSTDDSFLFALEIHSKQFYKPFWIDLEQPLLSFFDYLL